jgi:hypothetical protein
MGIEGIIFSDDSKDKNWGIPDFLAPFRLHSDQFPLEKSPSR